jgi:hypothetical protein
MKTVTFWPQSQGPGGGKNQELYRAISKLKPDQIVELEPGEDFEMGKDAQARLRIQGALRKLGYQIETRRYNGSIYIKMVGKLPVP